MTPVMAYAIDAPALIAQVRDRLERNGRIRELDTLGGLSTTELELLVRLEREAR